MAWDEGTRDLNFLKQRCPDTDVDILETILGYDDGDHLAAAAKPWYAIVEDADGDHVIFGNETMAGISKLLLNEVIMGDYPANIEELYNDGKQVNWKISFLIHQPEAVLAAPEAEIHEAALVGEGHFSDGGGMLEGV
jgi:hypothetical protein